MVMNSEKKVKSKKDQAYEWIRSRILNHEFGPGQRIVIDQIAKELGLSIIPVREAIRKLEADGLIEYKPNIGPIINMIDEVEYVEALKVLSVLEGYATALSLERMTDEVIASLKQMNQQMKIALDEYELEKFGKLNRGFHRTIFELCGNCYLMQEIDRINGKLDAVRRSIFTILTSRPKQSVVEHDQLIELFDRRASFEEVETFARNHKMNTVIAFEKRKQLN